MKMALKDKPDMPFRVPPGIKLISVDVQDRHALRAGAGSILEAFKPGTAPPDSYGGGDAAPRRAERLVPKRTAPSASGTGGLY